MNNRTNYLPIGSIVQLKESNIRIMIIARCVSATIQDKRYYLDYVGCVFPFGMDKDEVLYFSEEDIETIHFKGYANDEEVLMQDILNKAKVDFNLPKGSVRMFMN